MSRDEKNANKDPANKDDANAKFSGIKVDEDARVAVGGADVRVKGEGQTVCTKGASFEFDGKDSEIDLDRLDLRAKEGKTATDPRGTITVKKDAALATTDKATFAADLVCGKKDDPVLDLQTDAEIVALEKTADAIVTTGETTMVLPDKTETDCIPLPDRCNRVAAATRRMRALAADAKEVGTVEVKAGAKLILTRPDAADDATSDEAKIGARVATRATDDINKIADDAKADIAAETDVAKKKKRARKAFADVVEAVEDGIELDDVLAAKMGDKISKAARKIKRKAKRAALKAARKELKKKVPTFEDDEGDEERAEVEQKIKVAKDAEVRVEGAGRTKIRIKSKTTVEVGGTVRVKPEKRNKAESPNEGATKFAECRKAKGAECAKKAGSAVDFDGGVENKGEIAIDYPTDMTDDEVPVPITRKCGTDVAKDTGKVRANFDTKEDAVRATNKVMVACNEDDTLSGGRRLALSTPTMGLSVFVNGKDVSAGYELKLTDGGYELTATSTASTKVDAAAGVAPMTSLVAAAAAILAVALNM